MKAMFIAAATAIGIAVRLTTWTGETPATPAIATIAAVIGETTRPKLVIICIGRINWITSIFIEVAIVGAKAEKEKNAALPEPIKNAQPAMTADLILTYK